MVPFSQSKSHNIILITLNLQPTIINFSCLVVLWVSWVFEYYSTKGATHACSIENSTGDLCFDNCE